MANDIQTLATIALSTTRKGFFRSKPVLCGRSDVSQQHIRELEARLGVALPEPLQAWLLAVGYGNLDDELSLQCTWFAPIEKGELTGGAMFAQDILGNFYAFDSNGGIYFLSRSEPVVATVAKDFLEFMGELIRRDFKVVDWVDSLETRPYAW